MSKLMTNIYPVYAGKRIVRVSLYQVNLLLHEGKYKWASGKGK